MVLDVKSHRKTPSSSLFSHPHSDHDHVLLYLKFIPPSLFSCRAALLSFRNYAYAAAIDGMCARGDRLSSGYVVDGVCRWSGAVAPVAAPWLLCACTAATTAAAMMFMHNIAIS